jgi:hypothetical protein
MGAQTGRAAAEALRAAVTGGTVDGIAHVLAADVAFRSPAFAQPSIGRDTVAVVLATARQVYAGLTFTDLIADGERAALFFEASVEGEAIEGCYRVRATGDGAVAELAGLFRPVAPTEELVRAMMARLAAGGQ